MQSYQDAVLKTVMFWSDKSFRTALNQNNGDTSPNGGMAFALMNIVSMQAKTSITAEKIKAFEDKLTQILMSMESGSPYDRTLDVDYHPCTALAEAARHAGIDTGCFPCKTFTRIEKNNEVTAKYQYGGAFVQL